MEARLLNSASQEEVIQHLQFIRNQYKHDYNLYLCRNHRGNDRAFSQSATYTSAQNGPAERSLGLIITKVRAMLISTNFPDEMWPEALETAAYLHNKSPQQALGWQSPLQRLHQ